MKRFFRLYIPHKTHLMRDFVVGNSVRIPARVHDEMVE